jgi:NADH dehydrogenase (ubiquinone) 1 beta subcomplex subunit 7
MGNGFSLHYFPETTPDNTKPTAFDPNFGFKEPRKERGERKSKVSAECSCSTFCLSSISVMVATEAEMISAKLLPDERDFCAHKLIDYKACRADVWPFVYKCTPEKHDYLNCQYDE